MAEDGHLLPDCGPDCWLKRVYKASATSPLVQRLPVLSQRPPPAEAKLRATADQIYTPLFPWQIRVLELFAGEFDQPLEGRLLKADITPWESAGVHEYSQMLPFDALSYSWGKPAFVCSIKCDNIDMPITLNLAEALRNLRLPNKKRLVWTDACCINQYNLQEKADQVKLMFTIFQKAQNVLAWLGYPQAVDYRTFDIASAINSDGRKENRDDHGASCRSILESVHVMFINLTEERPWFFRTWVRQEVFAARKLYLMLGQKQLKFEDLEYSATFLRSQLYPLSQGKETHYGELTHYNKTVNPLAVRKAREGFRLLCDDYRWKSGPLKDLETPYGERGKHHLIIDQLHTQGDGKYPCLGIALGATSCDASIPHDKVYGLLGMMKESTLALHKKEIPAFPVDYALSFSTVSQRFLKFLLNVEGNLAPLSIFEDRRDLDPDLPSWTLDLRASKVRICNVWPFRTDAVYHDIMDVGHLRLKGYTVGLVDQKDSLPYFDELYGTDNGLLPPRKSYGQPESEDNIENFFDFTGPLFSLWNIIQRNCSYDFFRIQTRIKMVHIERPRVYALASSIVQKGDELAFLEGSNLGFILRPLDNLKDQYKFLGPTLVLVHSRPYEGTRREYVRLDYMNKGGYARLPWPPRERADDRLLSKTPDGLLVRQEYAMV